MLQLDYNCRVCKKVTKQDVRIVTENLPPNVKTIQCQSCACMTVALLGDN
jgi:hypothetical protein